MDDLYTMEEVSALHPDTSNPRRPDPHRLHLLRLSISRLGMILPLAVTPTGLVLSGHQRLTVAKELGYTQVPVQIIDIPPEKVRGINVMFNRITNDLGALDTGSEIAGNLDLKGLVVEAEKLEIADTHHAMNATIEPLEGLGLAQSDSYDKKAVVAANNFIRLGIEIPIVASESGHIVNGIHRLFAAKEAGLEDWPVVRIPDELADFAGHFLNYLSMDYSVDEDFAALLRYSAYRRPQNNRGDVPKAYRFWGNGKRTLPDKDSYSVEYWRNFRDLHGNNIVDFGAGLGKVAPFLNSKGMNCIDFEPYRIAPDTEGSKPDPDYSRAKALEFLNTISNRALKIDSIFLASVLNSVPFPQDRMAVLAIVHALSGLRTGIYGTCRDISDFHYEYAGIRQANYFVFDSEPGVRLGDAVSNPKIQKFMTQVEADELLGRLWVTRKFYAGGNIFYFEARNPKRLHTRVLSQALELEFHRLPYSDGTILGLGDEAVEAFSERLGVPIPRMSTRAANTMFKHTI